MKYYQFRNFAVIVSENSVFVEKIEFCFCFLLGCHGIVSWNSELPGICCKGEFMAVMKRQTNLWQDKRYRMGVPEASGIHRWTFGQHLLVETNFCMRRIPIISKTNLWWSTNLQKSAKCIFCKLKPMFLKPFISQHCHYDRMIEVPQLVVV